jgi:hypothetical protein
LTVAKPTPMWQVVSQNLYTDSTMTTTYDNTNTVNGARIYVSIKALNNGNTIWTNSGSGAVKLGTNNPQDRSSVFYDSTWSSINRVTTLQESSVAPGQVGTFNFWVTAPYEVNATTLSESFRLVIDGSTWFNDIGMYLSFTFNSPLTTWSYVGQSSYSNSTRTSTANLASATRNTSYYLQLKAKNTSGGVWKQSNTDLGTSNPQDRTSSFYDNSWIATNRATQLVETSVAPGQVGTFNFTIDTPNSAITSKEYFTPVIEGQSWMTDLGLYWNIVVN